MQKLVPLSKDMSSIGVDGDSHLVQFLKSTHVSCGRSLFLRRPLSRRGTEKDRKRSLESAQVSSLPMHSEARTETCQTFVFGPTTLQNLLRIMDCLLHQEMHLWMPSTKIRRRSMRTQCPVNSPMLSQDALRTCWTCKDQITPWMLRVHLPWQQ